ncbi:MAG: MMPL family transporter [Planctomycetaceae bacterium]|nr:MMPL family transporter [Planctomycetaceae bacterium]
MSRRAILCLVVMAALFPVVLYGAYRALWSMNDDAVSWTGSNLDSRRRLEWFDAHFAASDSILVSWNGCTLDDARLDRFAESLESGRYAWLDRVVTGRQILEELTAPPYGRHRAEAIAQLRNVMIGPDGETTCAVVILTDAAKENGREVLRELRAVAQDDGGIDAESLHLAGHLVETATINSASLATLKRLSLPSTLLVLIVAWPFLRSLRLAILVLATASFCECAALALVHFGGSQMNGMLAVMPILVIVVFVSGAVHLINYYRDALPHLGAAEAPLHAVRVGWLPCTLSIGTTALGIGSLALSHVHPVRLFGIYASLSMLLVLASLLIVLPGSLVLTTRYEAARGRIPSKPGHGKFPSRFWEAVAIPISRYHGAFVIAWIAVTLAASAGLPRLHGSMHVSDFFSRDTRIFRDHLWLERNVGPLLPVEVVVVFSDPGSWPMLDRLQVVSQLEHAIRTTPLEVGTVSMAAFLPKPGDSATVRDTIGRTLFNRQIESRRNELISASQYLATEGGRELWRIHVRLPSLSGTRYEDAVAAIENTVRRATAALPKEEQLRFSVVYTGMLPLLADAHPALMRDLIVSFGSSFLMIAVTLAAGLRSWQLGILAMVPNLFPILTVFGLMGWIHPAMDPGTMMTASIGLGIAVDDTVHFLTWFRRGLADGLLPRTAVRNAFQHCGNAMVRTTLICGAGLAVYGVSSFAPAARFGILVSLLLAAALMGVLMFLPALLSGPLGRLVAGIRK